MARKESLNSNKSFELLPDDSKSESVKSKKSLNSSFSFKSPESKIGTERKNSALSLNSSENNFTVENKERKYSIQSIESNKSVNNEKSVSIKSLNDSSSSDSEIDNKDITETKNSAKVYSSTYSETEELIYPKRELKERQVIHKKDELVYIQGEIFECSDDLKDRYLTHTATESVKPDSKSVSSSSSIDIDLNEEVPSTANEYTFESLIESSKTHQANIELPEENMRVNT